MDEYRNSSSIYMERYSLSRSRTTVAERIPSGEVIDVDLLHTLLQLEKFDEIKSLVDQGADFITPSNYKESAVFALAKWGYANILEYIATSSKSFHQQWAISADQQAEKHEYRLPSLISAALERQLPNLQVLKFLVEDLRVDLTAPDTRDFDSSEVTHLHRIMRSKIWWHEEALKYLLDHGDNPNARDCNGQTPLYLAVQIRATRMVRILLAQGADPNIAANDGNCCLNEAAKDRELTQLLLQHGADPSSGKYPFILDAIEARNTDALGLLLSYGADCNNPFVRGEEPNEGANMSNVSSKPYLRSDKEEIYPLYFAGIRSPRSIEDGKKITSIIELLLQNGADPFQIPTGSEPIIHDLCAASWAIEPFLKLSGLDLETRDSQGRTLLLAACFHEETHRFPHFEETSDSSASMLIAAGASLNARDFKGRNVLHLTCSDGKDHERRMNDFRHFISAPDTSALLQERDGTGRTPLLCAVRNGFLKAVDQLLERGADPLAVDDEGNTALHFLSRYIEDGETTDYFNKFISLGVSINNWNASGESPLYVHISTNNRPQGSKALFIEAGADFAVINNEGQGLLHALAARTPPGKAMYASFEDDGHDWSVETFKWLMDQGLDPAREDHLQRTPLDFAVASGNADILALFERKK